MQQRQVSPAIRRGSERLRDPLIHGVAATLRLTPAKSTHNHLSQAGGCDLLHPKRMRSMQSMAMVSGLCNAQMILVSVKLLAIGIHHSTWVFAGHDPCKLTRYRAGSDIQTDTFEMITDQRICVLRANE